MAYSIRRTGPTRISYPQGRPADPVAPKVPPTPRDEQRKAEDRRRAEAAWAAYDSLTAEFDRLLLHAYEQGHRDGRSGAPARPPTRDSIRRGQSRRSR
ncbi:hypothetical protein [Mangrovibrevibacter kandeliae]|uniref:hypothetical protein n=1 Tax=Mangrovibrevibacter kandeliae TaxID=2968473 RepID=UPI002118C81E|nr:hypothetical protein [Aurantimonas sp. CSK15Z-1]MCQ8781675.1 hypothetical protein [Aurantimonas sp. CSK15Z-1]